MAKSCEYCDSIPWENIKNWRLVDGGDDARPVVDFTRLNTENCFLCRAIGKLSDGISPRLTYCDAEGYFAEAYDGFLSANNNSDGYSHPSLATLGVFGEASRHARCERVDYEALRESMTECRKGWPEGHAVCRPEGVSEVHDLVVIDCERNALVFAAPDCKYLALSYVWGTSSDMTHFMSLPKSTGTLLPATRKRVLPGRVPRVVYDAMTVTKELGFRYLWIDRYCIDQQDADTKHEQIQQMWSIYSSAYVTLVAAAGHSPNHGLPGVSLPRRQDREKRGAVTIAEINSIDDEIRASTWAKRAWTFQENLASSRRIFFTDLGASYACEAYFRTDLGQTVLQDSEQLDCDTYKILKIFLGADASRENGDEKIRVALECLEAYCARNLTYESDSLSAILGMLVRLSQSSVDPLDHVWGTLLVPVRTESCANDYQLYLHWSHRTGCRRRNGFPTWSPLAWEGWLEHYMTTEDYSPVGFEPAFKVYLLDRDGYVDVDTYARGRRDALGRIRAGMTASPGPMFLKFESARVLPISSVAADGYVSVVFQYSDTEDLVPQIYWDSEPHGLEIGLIGVVLSDRRSGDILIMLLRPLEGYHERIGMARVFAINGKYPTRDRRTGAQALVERPWIDASSPLLFWSEYTEDIIVG